MEEPGLRLCSVCGVSRGVDCFSKKQWGGKAHSRRCSRCVQTPDSAQQASKGNGGKSFSARAGGVKPKAATGVGAAILGGDGKKSRLGRLDASLDPKAREALRKMIDSKGGAAAVEGLDEDEDEDDPFVCDITGALISMVKDGRYHFEDGRGPEDPSAVCMSVAAFNNFGALAAEHPETWEKGYADKSMWRLIPAGSKI